jgi:outer membrane protein assembly factor BamB
MMRFACLFAVLAAIGVAGTTGVAQSAEEQPAPAWTVELPARAPAWQFTPNMPRDTQYEPVTHGRLVLIGCEHNGAVLALDAASGAERWRFYTEAPIRVAPVSDGQRIFVGSDDGHLYCLDATGQVLWKFRGGPSPRKVIGHDRLMSAWPVNARPVVADGRVFFTAGYWPVDGIYVHALDAASGNLIWSNARAQLRPHGAMQVADGTVFVGGFAGSGAFDVKTGRAINARAPSATTPAEPAAPRRFAITTTRERVAAAASAVAPNPLAQEILAATDARAGYAVVAGLTDGALVEGLLRQSQLRVVAVDADAAKVERLRRQFDGRGLFDDRRLTVLAGEPAAIGLPPYFASLIVSELPAAPPADLAESLRPYGGAWVDHSGGRLKVSRRDGALPGAGDWTHELVDAGNVLGSSDTRVRAPLGILWYGGEAAHGRFYFDGSVDHQSGHGVNPLPAGAEIVQGKMILQGPGRIGAFDIYTGRTLWETRIPTAYVFGGPGGGVGRHSGKHREPWKYEPAFAFDVPPTHRSRTSGFNFVSMPDRVYIAAGQTLVVLDTADGSKVAEWKPPVGKNFAWGSIRVWGEVLVATVFDPQNLVDAQAGHDGNGGEWAKDRMPMNHLVGLDRHSGRLLWSREAQWGFLNPAIALGNDRAYVVDLITRSVMEKLAEAGRKFSAASPSLTALDLKTGRALWSHPLDIHVVSLTYSATRDVLLVPCRSLHVWRNGAWVEEKPVSRFKAIRGAWPGMMRALQGRDGRQLWEVNDAPYFEPHIVMDDLIIDRFANPYNLNDGQPALRVSAVTGQKEPWSFRKGGCNHLVASPNLATWRIAFYDLANHSGSMPLRGMDSGCTPSLLPAGGVLNVPNFGTHHKRNRMTALAMIHRPDNSLWASYSAGRAPEPAPVARAGYNLGAPGDRAADDGTLWLRVGTGNNPGNVALQPQEVRWFHAPRSDPDGWITGTGAIGLTEVVVPTLFGDRRRISGNNTPRRFDIRLYFMEPEPLRPGQRVFDISLAGQTLVQNLDIVRETGGPNRPLMREFTNVEIRGPLKLAFTARAGEPLLSGIELRRRDAE